MSKLEMFGWAVASVVTLCALSYYVLIPIASSFVGGQDAEYLNGRCNGFSARKNVLTGVVQRPVGNRDGMRWMDMPIFTWQNFVEDK